MLLAPALHAETIMVFGDSLSSGYGLSNGQGWVSLLQKQLAPEHNIINASISGETTDGGLSRLPQMLKQHHPDITIIELGGNDGLRGLPLQRMKANLGRMIQMAQQAHSKVVLIGMALPPNYGSQYTQQFASVYKQLGSAKSVAFVPLLVSGFEADLSKFQPDGIHPTAAMQNTMMHTVLNKLPIKHF